MHIIAIGMLSRKKKKAMAAMSSAVHIGSMTAMYTSHQAAILMVVIAVPCKYLLARYLLFSCR